MKTPCVVVCMAAVVVFAAGFATWAPAAEAPLVEPVLMKSKAPTGEQVQIGLKAARPGVVITAATVRPREAAQLVMPLNDSGQMGDTAGDGIWSVSFPVPDGVMPGFYWLDFEAQVTVDGQPKSATASAQVEVLAGGSKSIEIVAPKAGENISGTIEVSAKISTAAPPQRVVAYLGAASAELQREGGEWRGALDTTRAANGRQRLLVVASPGGTSADASSQQFGAIRALMAMSLETEQPVTVRNPYQFYWGDLHAHTSYSDGVQTPVDAYRHAREVAKIDFFAVTDHDAELTFDEYADVRRQADAFDKPGSFAALYGVEWTTTQGHICYYMGDRFRLSTDLESAYREFGELRVMAHFNHPAIGDFNHGRYSPMAAAAMYGVEARNPQEEASYIQMLNAGWRVGTDGSQDKHNATWGDGPHWTVALAKQLSRRGILEALRARRTYSTWDRNMRLEFVVDGEDMGAAISRPAGRLPCIVDARDPDAGERITRIDLIVDGRTGTSVSPGAAAYHWRTRAALGRGRHYVFVRVTEADGNVARSSPVWVWAE
jgi:hypothetical protein